MKKSEMIEIRNEKAKSLYEELEAIKDGIERILKEVKPDDTIDALKLAEYINDFSFAAFMMHGSAYSLNTTCALCNREDE